MFSCEFWEISKNTFFVEHLWATDSESPRQQHPFTEFCSALIEKNKIFLQCFCMILGHTSSRNQKILVYWIFGRKGSKFSKDEVFNGFLKRFITTFWLERTRMKVLMVFQFLNQTPYQVSMLWSKMLSPSQVDSLISMFPELFAGSLFDFCL